MKVVVKRFSDKGLEGHEYKDVLIIEIDGKREFKVADGEPEDANLMRDFNDCLSIIDLMQKAYKAGKNGETFEVKKKLCDSWEDLEE